jgi:hypothetical protein
MDDNLKTQIIKTVLIGGLTVGGGAVLIEQTRDMAKAAIEAQHHQMSYSKFTKSMLNATPKAKPNKLKQ